MEKYSRHYATVVPVFSLGANVPEFGMPFGVHGCGACIGYQVVTYRLVGKYHRPKWSAFSWIYPTEKQAKVEAKRLNRRLVRK